MDFEIIMLDFDGLTQDSARTMLDLDHKVVDLDSMALHPDRK